MKTFEKGLENTQFYPELAQTVEQARRNNLAEFERKLASEEGDKWWSLSGDGVQDETGSIWMIYNRWCDETRPEGWRVLRCEKEASAFYELGIREEGVVRTEIRPTLSDEFEKIITYQLKIWDHDGSFNNNDILNVLLYQTEGIIAETKIKLWNHSESMIPVEWQVEPEKENINIHTEADRTGVAA